MVVYELAHLGHAPGPLQAEDVQAMFKISDSVLNSFSLDLCPQNHFPLGNRHLQQHQPRQASQSQEGAQATVESCCCASHDFVFVSSLRLCLCLCQPTNQHQHVRQAGPRQEKDPNSSTTGQQPTTQHANSVSSSKEGPEKQPSF